MNRCFDLGFLLILSITCGCVEYDWKPGFHITTEYGWLNDPHPAFSRDPKGLYHVFYQCNLNSTLPPWGPGQESQWCHDTSENLATWHHNSYPGIPNGSASGTVIQLKNGSGVALYGIGRQSQGIGLSTSVDKDLMTWKTSPFNPVITTPTSINASYIGDPYLWKEMSTNSFLALVGSAQGDPSKSGSIPQALLFNSSDLVKWTYVTTVWIGNSTIGPRAECVALFPITDELFVYIFSSPLPHRVLWFVGKMGGDHKFVSISEGYVDYGHLYAASTFTDPRGRQILYGWVSESVSDETAHNNGYQGMESVPRVISLSSKNTLLFTPAEEISLLHGDNMFFNNIELPANATYSLGRIGNQLHLILTISGALSPNSSVGMYVLANENNTEYTTITLKTGESSCDHIGEWLNGTDMPGSDYTNFKVDGHDPAVCQKACCQDPKCLAWTFADPQPLLLDKYYDDFAFDCVSGETCCWLKGAQPSPVARTNCTSGTTTTQLFLEVSSNYSSLLPSTNVTRESYSAPVTSSGGSITMEIFIDKSSVEVFGNEGEVAITSRAYPTLAESDGIMLFTENSPVMFTLDVWYMNDAYKSQ